MPVKDLSTVHELITELFSWPQTKEEWQQYALSEEQIEFFKKNGYLKGIKMLDERQIKILWEEVSK